MVSMFSDICERCYVFGAETHLYGSLVISSHNRSLRRQSENLVTDFLRRRDQLDSHLGKKPRKKSVSMKRIRGAERSTCTPEEVYLKNHNKQISRNTYVDR